MEIMSAIKFGSASAYSFSDENNLVTYYQVEILQDVPDFKLKRGMKFDLCYLEWSKKVAHFIVWQLDRNGVFIPDGSKTVIVNLPE